MDFIILNSDGSLQKQSLTRYIQQGSHGVDEIFIGWANATSSQTLQAVFTLPNQLTNTELGVFEEDYEYEPGETMSGWVITLTENQTRYNGALMVSARVILNGIVQVAYPFALCINETGVRPETDSGITLAQLDSYLLNIQNLVTGAVRQNTDAALSSTSENPVQNKVITSAIDAIKRGSFTLVDTTEYPTLQDFLDSEGEEGYLYLYPVDTSDEDEGYYQYIWENDLWIPLGTTKIDIANMVTTDTNQTITAAKTIKEELNFADKTNTSSTLNSIKTDEYGGMVFSRGGVSAFGVGGTDVRFYNRHILPNNGNTTYSLGSSSAKWNYVYANYVSDGTNNIAVSDIAKQGLVASQFDETVTYNTGDLVIYQGTLYKMTSSIYAPGSFLPSLFTETSVADELANAGGSDFWIHNIYDANKGVIFQVTTTDSTPLTVATLGKWLYDHKFRSGADSYGIKITANIYSSKLRLYVGVYSMTGTSVSYRVLLVASDFSSVTQDFDNLNYITSDTVSKI